MRWQITVYYGDKSIDVTLTDAANTTASTGDGDIYLSTAAFTALAGSLDVGMSAWALSIFVCCASYLCS